MSESNHAEPKQDAVVEALVPDPTDLPPRVTMLRGFLGNSPADDQMRLYLTSSLDNYVTIHKTAILLIKELPDGQ
jgi:hypothetical protein